MVALAAPVDPYVSLSRSLRRTAPPVRAPSTVTPPTTSVYQAPRNRVASVVSESCAGTVLSCHQARPRTLSAPTPGCCWITPVTAPTPRATLPRTASITAAPDPAATPSERVVPDIVALTAGRTPPVRCDNPTQTSARPWLAQTPPSSSDTAPLTLK